MTANDTIIDFVERKFLDNYEYYLINLLTEADLSEIRTWTDAESKEVLQSLNEHQCPWCWQSKHDCFKCWYGKRHGICKGRYSDYHVVLACRQRDGYHADKDGTTEALKEILDRYHGVRY